MKKFILHTFLYLLPVLVFFILFEILLRHIPNDYSYKKNYLDANADKIETLILGNSHTYYGIDPVYFSTNDVFNASHVSQSLDYDCEILKRYEAKLNNLKTVVIPVSYFTLWGRLSAGKESWRVKNYVIYYKISTNNDKLKYHLEVLSNKFTTNIRSLKSWLQGNNITCSKQGWGISYNSKNAHDLEETGKTAATRHTRNNIHSLQTTRIFNDNISILDSIINLCIVHNANVLLVTPPAYKTYCQHLNSEQLTVTIETANKIADKYQNCTYLNLMTDSSFVSTDYYDADHLSEIGAKKLSVLIDTYIKNSRK
ncbi:MAG: hypothetical protein LBG80_05435 [Bacteroidales bacterium]|jgi:hypothetical protein|nr:hypothetical protein [Bacteroidales bacterium]